MATLPPLPSDPVNRRNAAFTLTELLTVIAIIGILTAIIIPVVARVRTSARTAACLSNLRQIGVAGSLYASENKNRLVPIANGTGASDAFTWRGLLLPYLGDSPDLKVLRCPADVSNAPLDRQKFLSPPSYGINVTSGLHDYLKGTYGEPEFRGNAYRFSDIKNPSRTIFAADIGNALNPDDGPLGWEQKEATGNYGYAVFPQDAKYTSASNWSAFPRHGGGRVNVVFYSGAVRSVHVVSDLIDHPPGDPLCIYKNQ